MARASKQANKRSEKTPDFSVSLSFQIQSRLVLATKTMKVKVERKRQRKKTLGQDKPRLELAGVE